MNNLVQLIEKTKTENVTRILKISSINSDYYKILFTPKLQNTDFKYLNNEVFITLNNEVFRGQYDVWILDLYKKLKDENSIENVIDVFNREIKSFIKFFEKEKKLSREKVIGFYGELLELKRMLSESDLERQDVLNGWHRPAPANQDFDYKDYSIEIKTIGRTSTSIKIATEHQLTSLDSKLLKLKVSRIDLVDKNFEDSTGKLYLEILNILEGTQKNIFQSKCAEDTFCKYLGPELMPLDYKLNEIESFFYNVDQKKFPRISLKNIDNGISHVKYDIDLSSIEEFKILN